MDEDLKVMQFVWLIDKQIYSAATINIVTKIINLKLV